MSKTEIFAGEMLAAAQRIERGGPGPDKVSLGDALQAVTAAALVIELRCIAEQLSWLVSAQEDARQ